MATSMDDILGDTPEEKPAAEVPEPEAKEPAEAAEPKEPKAEKPDIEKSTSRRKEHQRREWEAQGRDPETGQFRSKEKPDAPAEAAAPKEQPKAPPKAPPEAAAPAAPAQPQMTEKEKALMAELDRQRRRNQELERQRAAPQPPAEPKKFWDDPDGALKAHEQTIQQVAINTRLQTTETIARSKYTDFDEKITKFSEIVQRTPGLAQQWLAQADPAEFAYRTGKNHLELQQAGSLDKLRADIETKARAEERVKVEAEFKAREEAAAKQRAELPGSLSDVRGAASNKMPVWTGPRPMGDILKH